MFKKLFIILTVTIFCLVISAIAPRPAQALIQIKITDIGYKDCPEGVGEGSVTSGVVPYQPPVILLQEKPTTHQEKPSMMLMYLREYTTQITNQPYKIELV